MSLGLHAIAMSRFSGCWVAMKLVGALADGGETFEVAPDRPAIVIPELTIGGWPFQKSTDFTFFPGTNIETERRIYYERHQAVLALSWSGQCTAVCPMELRPTDAMLRHRRKASRSLFLRT